MYGPKIISVNDLFDSFTDLNSTRHFFLYFTCERFFWRLIRFDLTTRELPFMRKRCFDSSLSTYDLIVFYNISTDSGDHRYLLLHYDIHPRVTTDAINYSASSRTLSHTVNKCSVCCTTPMISFVENSFV